MPADRYKLATTYLGYQLQQWPIVVATGTGPFDMALPPAAQQLAEVVVRPNPHRAADYQRFLELFLGTSTLAKQYRARNPDAVQIDCDAERNMLTASAPRAFKVDNPALGYRLIFCDLDFSANFANQERTVTSLSHLAFRELPGGAAR